MKNSKFDQPTTEIWCDQPQDKEVTAVVVLLHGLNLKPQRMDDWSGILVDNGALVVRFALYGHTGDIKHMRDVTAESWRQQFDQAMAVARKHAQQMQVPIHFVGFSLGALVCLEWLSRQPSEDRLIDKMVLIAPALSVPWYSRAAVNMLSIFGRGFMLPSRSPKTYRANRGTSIAAYQALFSLKSSLERSRYRNSDVSTLVLIDRRDELVDSRGIVKIMSHFDLTQWVLEIVDNKFAHDNYGFRHLMVDQEAIGQRLWSALSDTVIRHLEIKPGSQNF